MEERNGVPYAEMWSFIRKLEDPTWFDLMNIGQIVYDTPDPYKTKTDGEINNNGVVQMEWDHPDTTYAANMMNL